MNVARLNGSARAARINAERNTSELEAIYSTLILQAAREASTAFTKSTEVTAMAASGWLVPPEGLLLNVEALADKATQKLAKLHARIVRQSAAPILARAGVSWDVTHPLVQSLLDQSGARTGERLGATVRPVLQKIIQGAFTDGLPVRDTAALIRATIGEHAPGQAQMLARTDLNSLNNGGSIMAASIVGVQYKQWLTAEDDKVRETHAEADGQTVPIDQPFSVGGEDLDYPGDPGGSDEEVCNCRCTVVYVSADESIAASGKPPARVSFAPMSATRQRIPGRGFAAVAVEQVAGASGEQAARAGTQVAASSTGTRWEAVLAVEGEPTEDGRLLAPGSVTWRDLPLSLMAQTETQPGHDGAEVAGRIDRIWRDGSKIMGSGVFDGGEFGSMIGDLVREQTLRGVSVDLAVKEFEVRVTGTDEPADPDEVYADGDVLYVVTDGVIGAATVCSFQAIEQATISVVAGSNNGIWKLEMPDGDWGLPGPSLDDRLVAAQETLARTVEVAGRAADAEQRAADLERLVATATTAHMAAMQDKLNEAKQREEETARVAAATQAAYEARTEEQKIQSLETLAALTERIATGDKISEAMLKALSDITSTPEPRTVKVQRGNDGRAEAYEVSNSRSTRNVTVVRGDDGRAIAYEVA